MQKHLAYLVFPVTSNQDPNTKRANETSEQTLDRKQQERKDKASMRATKKTSDVSIQQAIMSFHSDIPFDV